MRILHLVHQFPPEHIGGTEFYTQWLVKEQQQCGHDVALFHRRSGSDTGLESHRLEGIPVWSAWDQPMTPRNRFQATFGNPNLSRHFEQVLTEFEPDLLHIQHLMGLPATLATPLQELAIPYFVTLHDYYYFCANAQLLTNYDHTLCHGPQAWINCARCVISRAGQPRALWAIPPLVPLLGWRNLLLKRVLNRAAGIISPTHFVKDVYVNQGVPADKVTVIGHGIIPPDEATQQHIAQRAPYKGWPLKVVYIGGVAPQKGVDVLITAVNQLPPEQIHCKIYGDLNPLPQYVDKLKQQIQHTNVQLAGKLARSQLWSALLEADLLVVPALWPETSSLVINEAFAAGLPVLVSQLGGMSEKVAHGQNGYHFSPGNAAELAQRLHEFIMAPEALNRLRTHIPPVRTIQHHTQDILNLYQAR